VDKYFGIRKLAEISGVPEHKILFVGDSVFPGGNDFAPFENGIITKRVLHPEDTLQFIQNILVGE